VGLCFISGALKKSRSFAFTPHLHLAQVSASKKEKRQAAGKISIKIFLQTGLLLY
jgi:hypothetical protein